MRDGVVPRPLRHPGARPDRPGAPSGPDRDGDLGGAARCEAEDRAHDLPLGLEWRANLATATLAMLDALSRDDFEAGDVPRWSAVSL